MSICKVLWLQLSLLLCPDLLAAHGVSNASGKATTEVHQSGITSNKALNTQGRAAGAEHRKAIEAHIRHSNHQIRLLMRSASMSNIDVVLDSIDAIRRTNEGCVRHVELCRKADASSNTAGASVPLQQLDAGSKL